MAQRPTNDFNIDPNVTSGTDLANILNRFQDAIDSGNSGPSRPAYLDAGGLWVRDGDPMRLYLYDGTTDRELYNTTDGLVGASQWKDNGDDIYYDAGNVGIGTSLAEETLDVIGSLAVNQATGVYWKNAKRDATNVRLFWNDTVKDARLLSTGGFRVSTGGFTDGDQALMIDNSGNVGIGTDLHANGSKLTVNDGHISVATAESETMRMQSSDTESRVSSSSDLVFRTGGVSSTANERVRIDAAGNVGIGMAPVTRTAKEQLAEWKASFDARLKAEPKADKKAVTLEITDDAFEVMPTEDLVAEWMETRAAGDKLQVDGNGSFSGKVFSNSGRFGRTGQGGLAMSVDILYPAGADLEPNDATMSLGTISAGSHRFKDAHFSGTVTFGQKIIASIGGGFSVGSGGVNIVPCDSSGNTSAHNGKMDLGAPSVKFKDCYLSGSVKALRVIQDGSPVIDAKGLINTLSTLRNATKDETVDVRQALASACDKLIEKFEAIQAEAEKAATMDIDD